MIAALKGHDHCVKVLLGEGAEIEEEDKRG